MAVKFLLGFGGSGLAIGALYAGGVLGTGEIYDLPLAQARSELAAMPIPAEVRAAVGGSDAAPVSVDTDVHTVTWRFGTPHGVEAKFVARLDSVDRARTRVTLSHSRGEPTAKADRIATTAFMRSFAENSFAEQLDAQLEGRSFDQERALKAFADHAARNPQDVEQLGIAVGEIFNEVNSEMADSAFADQIPQPIRARERMEAATRPMVDLPRN
jgi:hypothetical protein